MTEDVHDVIVVGGGYAGVTAANRLPRGTRVLLLDPKEDFVLKPHVEHRRGNVVHVEPGLVRLPDGDELRGRHILLTTGSDQAAPDGTTSLETASVVREGIALAEPGSHIAVHGAGLTGIELAAELAYRRSDLVVHLQGRSPVGAGLPQDARDHLRSTLLRMGVRLDGDAPPPAQVSIDATGLHVSALARDSALDTDRRGRMRVAQTLEAAPGVWGAGDAVIIDDQPHLRASCATAIPMGAHAADNIARALEGAPPTAFRFGYSYRCISLGRRNGLILTVDPLDTPTGTFTGGIRAALFKSAICAAVIRVVSTFARSYAWAPADGRDV